MAPLSKEEKFSRARRAVAGIFQYLNHFVRRVRQLHLWYSGNAPITLSDILTPFIHLLIENLALKLSIAIHVMVQCSNVYFSLAILRDCIPPQSQSKTVVGGCVWGTWSLLLKHPLTGTFVAPKERGKCIMHLNGKTSSFSWCNECRLWNGDFPGGMVGCV